MIRKLLVLLTFCGAWVHCTLEKPTDREQNLHDGLQIENGINRGVNYTDSVGGTYSIRYIPITITNDTSLAIQFQINFSATDYLDNNSQEPFSVIPLPERWAMDGVEITDSLLNEIPEYQKHAFASKTLKPGETWLMAIGTVYSRPAKITGVLPHVLFAHTTETIFPECDWNMEEHPSSGAQLLLGLRLRLGGNCMVVPAGQMTYLEK
ncbi:MAG: hypothetical protein KTR30_23980 [Saprospiraceae bacterium]|nr:hypothetical protein [Saprospiraceae bacterium]